MDEINSKSVHVKLIGYWIQSLDDDDYPPPQEFVSPLPDADREVIAAYLDEGEIFESYRGYSWCRFYCSRKMGSREFSDGHWVWPEDLGHYVRDHGVVLPMEFILHVKDGVPRIPKLQWDQSRIDLTFWKDWCRQSASGRFRTRIVEARFRANQTTLKNLADECEAVEKKHGKSDQVCQWAGCGKFALKGRWLCASCLLRGNWTVHAADSNGLRTVLLD